MNNEIKSEFLKNYIPFKVIDICSNQLENVDNLFLFDYIAPVIIGYNDNRPLIWLSMKQPGTVTWFLVVSENVVLVNELKIDFSEENTTTIKKDEQVIIKVENISKTHARIKQIDLRPLGLNVFCEQNELHLGKLKYIDSKFVDSPAMVIFETSFKQIFELILNRFPAGREASYLLNNKEPDIEIVLQNLKYIAEGKDSDRRYTDDYSKRDAISFISLIKYLEKGKI